MSTEHHNTSQSGELPTHADVKFESTDINTRTILAYLLYLAIAVAIAFGVSVYIFKFTTKLATDSDTQMAPSHRGVGSTMPPEPMLQGVPGHENDPQLDLRNKRDEDDAANDVLKWKDKQAGIAQIPVEEAMKIIVTKGLPAVPPASGEKKK